MTKNDTTDDIHPRVRLLALLLLECAEDDDEFELGVRTVRNGVPHLDGK
jgi:hypothetical protein